MASKEMLALEVISTLDGSREKNLFYFPDGKKNVPLVVGLHTWSADRFNQVEKMLPLCRTRNWALLLPEFRGPNLTTNPRATQACGSPLAKQDIMDAFDYVLTRYPIDKNNVFLLGGSGGAHMALMMASCAPARFRAVSSWCPITDLAAWHGQNAGYAPGIEACCGGKPGASAEVDKEYRERSPLFHVAAMTRTNLSVHHGRFDKSVPYSHTVNMALELEKLGPNNLFFEIFDGGHEIHRDRAFLWFEAFTREHEEEHLTG